ncbi:MAG: hypothetical protein ACKO3W_09795, partial [bacterium]
MNIELVRAPKLQALVRKNSASAPIGETPVLPGHEPNDPLAILLTNYLLWESTPKLAEEALGRLSRRVVDANELRVMLEREVIETLGEKYPYVEERATRLRATLNDIFRRQHRTSLDHLRGLSRKDQRAYLDGLAEIPPFVAGRTSVVAFENPAPIIDDSMVEVLVQEGAVDPSATTADVAGWIAKNFRVEEYLKVSASLDALKRAASGAGGKNASKLRDAYLGRHAGFRAEVEAEKARIEAEKRALAEAVVREAEERRLAE